MTELEQLNERIAQLSELVKTGSEAIKSMKAALEAAEEERDRLDYELPYECSECHERQGILPFNYCPSCGTRMKGE